LSGLRDIVLVDVARADNGAHLPPLPVAQLAMSERRVALEWSREALGAAASPDPLRYGLEPGLVMARTDHFGGLHGFLADSLPDAWGQRLLRRRLRRRGVLLEALTPLQRLALVGRHGRGALVYEPAEDTGEETLADIDGLARAAQAVLADEGTADTPATALLEQLGSGSGGARPKAHVRLDGADWIVKFPGPGDPADIGALEYVYARMAIAAGLEMSACRLLPASTGPGHFATQRFDRTRNGGRVHVVSLCGALEAPPGATALGYDTFLRATLAITRNAADVRAAFARMVFNILACNRDDHSRQHAFLQDERGTWQLAPAYDLTFSMGPGGEHDLDIDGEGRNPTRAHLARLAARHGIGPRDLAAMIEATRAAVSEWPVLAARAGVSRATTADVTAQLARVWAVFDGQA
jgi:serine/threonine-protein kinase HipA